MGDSAQQTENIEAKNEAMNQKKNIFANRQAESKPPFLFASHLTLTMKGVTLFIMRRFFTSAILAMGLFFGANAQEETTAVSSPNKFNFGIRMGLGASFIDGDAPFDETEKIINLHVGAAVTYDLSPNFDLESGLYYTKKGYYSDYRQTDEAHEVTANLYYLQIPVMLGYNFSISKSVSLGVKAGPYIAYGLNGNTKDEVTTKKKTTSPTETEVTTDPDKTTTTSTYKETIKEVEETKNHDSFDDFKRLDVGAKVALNCTIQRDFVVGLTYEHGLTNISDTDSDAFNKTLAITIGFNF